MNENSLGRIFRITTWGESHGPSLGVVVDGCPSGLELSNEDFLYDLGRRQGGQGAHTTPRKETDEIVIESGVYSGKTTGTPIALRITNSDQRSADYSAYENVPRPGHADITTHWKHCHRDHRGGGRASARETVARVAAGVVAKKVLLHLGIEVFAFLDRVGDLALNAPENTVFPSQAKADYFSELRKLRDGNAFGALSEESKIRQQLELVTAKQDSLGGSITCFAAGIQRGTGEPIFGKLGAVLGQALLSLPATTGFEVGGGFALSRLPGSEIRDAIVKNSEGKVGFSTNKHGGLLGGMATGELLKLRTHFHAPTSIETPIASVDLKSFAAAQVSVRGRHDVFPLPRAIPMVEAMVAIVLLDQTLLGLGSRLQQLRSLAIDKTR